RLRKLDEGQYDGIVLAAAGLIRLGLPERIRMAFDPVAMRPSPGQGALAIEVRSDRHDLIAALAPLAHTPTWHAVAAERTVSRSMGGSCSMPLAAYAHWDGAELVLDAAWGETEGPGPLVTAGGRALVTDLDSAAALGEHVVLQLRAGGAH
ncbi:MAG: hydroxymethylbilane synthase, partial [Rhodoferax sp.]|nr:hydroxymethylbilane synthase [Rhodoferax sp.]